MSTELDVIPADAKEFCGGTVGKDDPNIPQKSRDAFNNGVYGTVNVWTLSYSVTTCYCHHFTEDLRHCVSFGLGPEHAHKCKGVLYGSLMSMGGSLYCAEGRGGHSPCNAQKCPYVAAGRPCPYSEPKTEPKDRLVPIGHLPPTPDFKKGDVWADKPKVEEN